MAVRTTQVADDENSKRRDGEAVTGPHQPEDNRGVYGISVAAELAGTGVQNLRLYEARGLLEPDRTAGGTRRYSPNDIDRLHRIAALLDAGLNLAGIGMVMDLQDENAQLRTEKEEHQWLNTAAIRTSRTPRHTSSTNTPKTTNR